MYCTTALGRGGEPGFLMMPHIFAALIFCRHARPEGGGRGWFPFSSSRFQRKDVLHVTARIPLDGDPGRLRGSFFSQFHSLTDSMLSTFSSAVPDCGSSHGHAQMKSAMAACRYS